MKLSLLLCWLVAVAAARAADETPAEPARYRLLPRDLVRVTVHGEPDVSVERRLDALGEINVPLLGQVKLASLTAAEAQGVIGRRYVQEEIFVRPEVVVTIVEYRPREVMVLGQVGKQGKQVFPPEAAGISIVEAITAAGGFTRIGKSDAVRVTRRDERGVEQNFTVNVERMIDGRGKGEEAFVLQPGDVVFVPERVF